MHRMPDDRQPFDRRWFDRRWFDEIRLALRRLASNPVFTATVLVVIALGIGATTAVYTVVDSVLLRPLPYREAPGLVALFLDEGRGGDGRNPTSPERYLAWREESLTLGGMTAAHPWSPTLTGRAEPDRLSGLKSTPGLFDLLGVAPALGRTFHEGDGGDGRVVVLGHDLWQRRFGGDPQIVGRRLQLDGEPYVVLGVMPAGFGFPPFWATGAELWVPLVFTAEQRISHDRFLRVFARREPGAPLAAVAAEMKALNERQAAGGPTSSAAERIRVEPLLEPVVGTVRRPLLVLLAAVAFVLLAVCTNVAGMLLGRSAGQTQEMAIRSALGAGRGRLARLALAESLLLAAGGGALGFLLAGWWVRLLVRWGPAGLPRLTEISPDARVAVVSLGLVLVCGLGFGGGPAWRASRRGPAAALRQGGRGNASASRGQQRWRATLVVTEVGFALVLLVGAGLAARSLWRSAHIDPGFEARQLVTCSLGLAGSSHTEPAQHELLLDELVARVRTLPGVVSAAAIDHLPLAGDVWSLTTELEGAATAPGDEKRSAVAKVVGDDYFATLRAPWLAGRPFDRRDRAGSTPVAVVNRAFARRFAGLDGAAGAAGFEGIIGRRLRIGSEGEWRVVVGVVEDVAQARLIEPAEPEVDVPYSQDLFPWFQQASLVVRTSRGAAELAGELRAQAAALDPAVPVIDVRPMAEVVREQLAGPRFAAALLAAFAGVALLLCAVGLYALLGQLVRSRRHEIGVRMALGASRRRVLAGVVGRGLGLAAAGALVGLMVTAGAGELASGLLYGIGLADPWTYAVVVAVLLVCATGASYLPARRATRVDPMVALRAE